MRSILFLQVLYIAVVAVTVCLIFWTLFSLSVVGGFECSQKNRTFSQLTAKFHNITFAYTP